MDQIGINHLFTWDNFMFNSVLGKLKSRVYKTILNKIKM